jgi:hypothetical protein
VDSPSKLGDASRTVTAFPHNDADEEGVVWKEYVFFEDNAGLKKGVGF